MLKVDKHRKTALHIHSLNESDRRWMLSNLKNVDRKIINGHLNDLEGMSIPKDKSLFNSVFGNVNRVEVSEDDLYDNINACNYFDKKIISDILEKETSWISAYFIHKYPVLDEILSDISIYKRRDISVKLNAAGFEISLAVKNTLHAAMNELLKEELETRKGQKPNKEFIDVLDDYGNKPSKVHKKKWRLW
jgi:hypothetical protein